MNKTPGIEGTVKDDESAFAPQGANTADQAGRIQRAGSSETAPRTIFAIEE
jgi:hypothetical protein